VDRHRRLAGELARHEVPRLHGPKWKGLSWAPITAGLANRKFYVVEATPRDKYYLYGKIELYLDKVTFQGAWNRKFSWKGELINTLAR